MERIVNKARGFAAADEWDIRQQVALTPQQRQRAAHELKVRVHGPSSPDVRAWHRRK